MNKLYVVGLGPGGASCMTQEAMDALREADILCGYTVYIDLVRELFPDKEFLTTPMTKELERCRLALSKAAEGKTTALLSSGDPGVYAMAGPVLSMQKDFPDVEIKILPGVTAALSGAAVLGAPLMHDFCVISLSDLLTPWEVIEKRLRAAALGDFVICIYNPASRKRPDHLKKACRILLETKSKETVCGLVRNIGRDSETYEILTLEELSGRQPDMFTTVFVGSSKTQVIDGRMVTPRGYETKES